MSSTTKQRVFIECTQTFFHGGNSGIQRVVRNLANRGGTFSTDDLEVCPVVWAGFGFCQPRSRIKVKPSLLNKIKKKIQRLLSLVKNILPHWITSPVRKSLMNMTYLFIGLTSFPLLILFGDFVRFRKSDIVVMVDSTWRSQPMLDSLFKSQCDSGLILGVMLHDLFPLTLPDTCQEITAKGFVSWFEQVVPRADFFVTNSESTRESLASYLAENRDVRPNPYASGSFRLGAELDLVDSQSKPSPTVQSLWDTPGRAMLCIGTIEPRKNHMYLLDVFDIMRDRDEDVSLIILGRPGWKNEAILDRIRSHKDFDTRLLHLDDATDRDMEEALERSDCLICPSIDEGFGLPVVEGLMHGLKVFASDIGVYREIGGENCSFFDLNEPLSLANQLTDWFGFLHGGKSSERDDFSWPDWEESTGEFVNLTLDLAAQSQKSRF